MASRFFGESIRSRSRQSSRNSLRIRGNGKGSEIGIGSGEVNATWFYDADAPADGKITMRGRLLLEQDNNKAEEVTVTLQNGMLNIQKSAASAGKNARSTAIALQDANINSTPKLGPYGSILINIPSRNLEFALLTDSEDERDQWVDALRYNSLAHIRLIMEELSTQQGQTEADLREARRRADESNQQVRDLKNDFAAQKASLEHDKARLMEAYENLRGKQEHTESALRATKRDLEAARKELNSLQDETSAQITDTKQKLNDDLRRTKSSYDAKIERLSREVADRNNQLHNLSGDLQSAHSERHQADQTVASMNRDLRVLKQKCGELQVQLEESNSKLRISNEKREELQNNLIASQAASERAQQKLGALTNEIKDHKSGRQVLEREVTGRRGQLSTLQSQSRDLQRQVANLKGQLQVQRQESERHVKGLKETIHSKDGDLHKLHRANVELEAKYEVLRAELRDKTARLKGIQKGGGSANEQRINSRMSSMRPEFAQTLVSQYSGMSESQRQELEGQLAAAQRKIQQLEENTIIAEQAQAKLNQEREEAAKLQLRLKEMEGELDEQQKQLQQADQQITLLQEQNAQIDSLKDSAQRSQQEVVNLQKQLQEFHADSAMLEESKKRESQLLDKLASFENRAAEFNNQMHNLEHELMQTRHQANNLQKDKEDLLFKSEDLERELMEVQARFYEAQDDTQRLQDQLTLERKSIQVESQSLNRQRHNITVALKGLLSNVQANSQAFDASQPPIAPPHTSDPLPLIHLVEQVVGEIVAQRDSIQRELVAIESSSQQDHLKQQQQQPVLAAINTEGCPSTLQEAAQALNSPGVGEQSPTAFSASPRISGLRRAASEVNQRTIEREISLKMYIDLPALQNQQLPPNMSLPSNNIQPPKIIEEEEEEDVKQVTSYTGSKQDQTQDTGAQLARSGIVLEHSSNNIVQDRQFPAEEAKQAGGSEGAMENKVIIPPTMRDLQDKLNQLAHQQAALEDELYRNSSVQKDLQIKLKELRSVKKDSLSEEESRRLEKELTSISEALEFTKDSVKKLETKIYDRQLSAQSLGRRLKGGEGGDVEGEGGDGSGVGEKSRTHSRSLSSELADAEAEALRLKEMEQSAAKTAHQLEQLRVQLKEKDDILSDMHTRETELLSEVTQLNQKLSKKQTNSDSVGKQVADDADSTRDARLLDPNAADDPEHKTQLLASYRRELGLRRQLHNMVLDLKGSIRVMTRLNPLQPGEQQGQLRLTFPEGNMDPQFPTTVLQVDSDHDAEQLSRKYEFDRVFQSEEGNERIYQEMEGVLASVLEGYKVCLVCYGHNSNHSAPTGSTEDTTTRGIMWRTIQALFREGQSMRETEMKVSLSMVEVGPGGSLSDLLAANPHAPINNQIISNKKQSLVSQFTRAGVDNAEKAQQALHAGFTQRNCTGGGSNLLYVVDVETMNLQTNVKCLGKLYIADLVGTDGQDALGSLEVIITSLVMRSNHFLAGRRTPLTKLLYEAMGGNARVLLLTSVSPASGRESATMATLKFALRAMAAELGPAVPIKKLPGAPTPSSHRMSPVYPYSSSNETQPEN